MTKRIVLCADDYGQAPSISKGIIQLIHAKRLSATSCMVNRPLWQAQAMWLAPFKEQIDIGLHFNLTEGQSSSLTSVICQAYSRQLNKKVLIAECHAQIDAFIQGVGQLPHFIDGHQHVHQLPIIREAMLEVYEERLRQRGAYIRLVNPRLKASDAVKNPKKIILTLLGMRALKQALIRHRIPHNQTFSGIYPFSQPSHYAQLFPVFLREVENGGLIMCHPGLPEPAMNDPISSARAREFAYLMSEQFLLDTHDVILSRFTDSTLP